MIKGQKMTKAAFLLLVVLLILLSGCAANEVTNPGASAQSPVQPDITAPDIAAIIAKQSEAMKTVTSCQADVQLAINFKPVAASAQPTSIKADMNSQIDVAKHLLSSTVYTDLTLSGLNQKSTQQLIATGDSVYIKENKQGQWQKKTLDQPAMTRLWNEQDEQITGLKYSAMITPAGFTYAGKEKINGHTCYMLKQPLDTGQIGEMTGGILGDLQNTQGLTPQDIGKMVKNAELVCLIDAATYYLREFRVSAQIKREMQGQSITGSLQQSFRFDAFNEPVSIQIPEVNSHE
jgi:hypothetical protein